MASAETIEIARGIPPGFVLACAMVFGAFVGSFTNVVAWRLPRQCLSINNPRRSFCPKCKAQLAWYDNIPVLGWILLLGRCRYCRKAISPRYPLVEAAMAALFGLAVWRTVLSGGPGALVSVEAWLFALAAVVAISVLIPVALIDWDLTIIPDELAVGPLLFFVPMAASVTHMRTGLPPDLDPLLFHALPLWLNGVLSALVAGAAGSLTLWLIGKAGNVLFPGRTAKMGGESMGFGDVKLVFLLGVILGWPKLVAAFFIAILLGASVGLVLRVAARFLAVPFGPFLVAGTLAALLFTPEILQAVDWYIALITPQGVPPARLGS